MPYRLSKNKKKIYKVKASGKRNGGSKRKTYKTKKAAKNALKRK